MKARATIVLALILLACAGCKPPNLLPPGDTANAPQDAAPSVKPA